MLEATKARVAPVSSAMLYGRGVFTTVAVYNAKPFLWPEHWRRLEDHAERLNVDCSGTNERSVGEALRKLIAVNQVRNGRARVILLARSGRDVWKPKKEGARKTDLLILTSEAQKASPAGMSLAVSPYRFNTFSPLVGICDWLSAAKVTPRPTAPVNTMVVMHSVNFDRIWSWPKPIQKPRPPVLMGGDYAAAIDRVIEFGDEWMPHPDRGEQPLNVRISEFWRRSEAAGRGRLPITVYGSPVDARLLDEYQAAGVSRCIFRIPAAAAGTVLPALDRAGDMIRRFGS